MPSRWELAGHGPALVKAVVLGAPADYGDAIVMAVWLSELPGYYPEGGVRNVARRAGLGTVLLHAVEAMGRLPEHYFQAVGSAPTRSGSSIWPSVCWLMEASAIGRRG